MTVPVGPGRMSARRMSCRLVRKNWNGKSTTTRISRLHDADQNARNDHERSDADQNLAVFNEGTPVTAVFIGAHDETLSVAMRVKEP
jgi:hypothetical protein